MISDDSPIRKRKLSDDVQERLLAFVQSGELRPGDPLPSERELMTSFHVGRPAIREAMQSLQRMGLIEIRHGERARIAEPSAGRMIEQMSETVRHMLSHSVASLEHLKEARATFELEMARVAARRRSAADIVRLRDIIERQRQAKSTPSEFLMLDGMLHREIAAVGGNPIFPAVSEAVFQWLAAFHVDLVQLPGAEELTLAEHTKIVDAIDAKDSEAAAKAMLVHLTRANSLYRHGNTSPRP